MMRSWAGFGGLIVLIVAFLAGCGRTPTYSAADVDRAFGKAGIHLYVGVDSQASAVPGSATLNAIARDGPKILIEKERGSKNMSVLVYPHTSDARAQERSVLRFIHEVQANPKRYAAFKDASQINDNGMIRRANVVVLYRKSVAGLSGRVTRALAALH